MEKGDTFSTYLNKLITYKDEIGSVGITTADDDMVSLTLLGLPNIWNSYEDSMNGREKLPDWELLCGVSFHMTGDKKLFSALEEKDLKMCIEMGDTRRYSFSGKGTLSFQRAHGAPLTLTDVMYVPGLKKSLVSVMMLEDKVYDVVFSKGNVFLRHITTGLPKGKLEQVDTCKGCTLGNYTKSSFHDQESGAEAILERVYTDLCGPFLTASTMKKRFNFIFINDYSREFWIYFMQKKDQTFTKFCEFKALVKKESGKKIKALRSDISGEYVSQEFKDFYAAEGIK
eukprot:PITA_19357